MQSVLSRHFSSQGPLSWGDSTCLSFHCKYSPPANRLLTEQKSSFDVSASHQICVEIYLWKGWILRQIFGNNKKRCKNIFFGGNLEWNRGWKWNQKAMRKIWRTICFWSQKQKRGIKMFRKLNIWDFGGVVLCLNIFRQLINIKHIIESANE